MLKKLLIWTIAISMILVWTSFWTSFLFQENVSWSQKLLREQYISGIPWTGWDWLIEKQPFKTGYVAKKISDFWHYVFFDRFGYVGSADGFTKKWADGKYHWYDYPAYFWEYSSSSKTFSKICSDNTVSCKNIVSRFWNSSASFSNLDVLKYDYNWVTKKLVWIYNVGDARYTEDVSFITLDYLTFDKYLIKYNSNYFNRIGVKYIPDTWDVESYSYSWFNSVDRYSQDNNWGRPWLFFFNNMKDNSKILVMSWTAQNGYKFYSCQVENPIDFHKSCSEYVENDDDIFWVWWPSVNFLLQFSWGNIKLQYLNEFKWAFHWQVFTPIQLWNFLKKFVYYAGYTATNSSYGAGWKYYLYAYPSLLPFKNWCFVLRRWWSSCVNSTHCSNILETFCASDWKAVSNFWTWKAIVFSVWVENQGWSINITNWDFQTDCFFSWDADFSAFSIPEVNFYFFSIWPFNFWKVFECPVNAYNHFIFKLKSWYTWENISSQVWLDPVNESWKKQLTLLWVFFIIGMFYFLIKKNGGE